MITKLISKSMSSIGLLLCSGIFAQTLAQGTPISLNASSYASDPIEFLSAFLGKPADEVVSQATTWKMEDRKVIADKKLSVPIRINEIIEGIKSWCSASKGTLQLTNGIPWHDSCIAEDGNPLAAFTVGYDSRIYVQVEKQDVAIRRYLKHEQYHTSLKADVKNEKLGIPILYFQRTEVNSFSSFGKLLANGIQNMETKKNVPPISGLIPILYFPRFSIISEKFVPLEVGYTVETKPPDNDRTYTYIRFKPLPAKFSGEGGSNGWIVGCVPGKLDRANCYTFINVVEYQLSLNRSRFGLIGKYNYIDSHTLFKIQGGHNGILKISLEDEYLAAESKDAVIEAESDAIRQENANERAENIAAQRNRDAERAAIEKAREAAAIAAAHSSGILKIQSASVGTNIFCNSGRNFLLMPGKNISSLRYTCDLTGDIASFLLSELFDRGWDIVFENHTPSNALTAGAGEVVNLRLKRLTKIAP